MYKHLLGQYTNLRGSVVSETQSRQRTFHFCFHSMKMSHQIRCNTSKTVYTSARDKELSVIRRKFCLKKCEAWKGSVMSWLAGDSCIGTLITCIVFIHIYHWGWHYCTFKNINWPELLSFATSHMLKVYSEQIGKVLSLTRWFPLRFRNGEAHHWWIHCDLSPWWPGGTGLWDWLHSTIQKSEHDTRPGEDYGSQIPSYWQLRQWW